jgi:hypothetical protein
MRRINSGQILTDSGSSTPSLMALGAFGVVIIYPQSGPVRGIVPRADPQCELVSETVVESLDVAQTSAWRTHFAPQESDSAADGRVLYSTHEN